MLYEARGAAVVLEVVTRPVGRWLAIMAMTSAGAMAQATLPITRPAAAPASVVEAGREHRVDGGAAHVPFTFGYAVSDLDVADWQIDARYPIGASRYPTDTIFSERVSRAGAWMSAVPTGATGPLMDAVFRAQLEITAGADVQAEATIARALATAGPVNAPSAGARRSAVLFFGLRAFLDPLVDDSLLARRVRVADAYAAQLEVLPAAGYAAVRDSLAVLDRARDGEQLAVLAHARLGQRSDVRTHAERLLALLPRYTARERKDYITGRMPVEAIGTALLGLPEGRAQLVAFERRAQSVVAAHALDPRIADDNARAVASRFQSVDSLGHAAPAIPAHVWFNTSDSMYSPAPRSRSLADGGIHILVRAGCREDCVTLAIVEQEQARLPSGASVLVLAWTEGHALTDLVEPEQEATWLDSLWIRQEHLTMRIALWAGVKKPSGFHGMEPTPWPLQGYPWPNGAAILVDGQGFIRGSLDPYSPRGLAELERCVTYLVAERAGRSAGMVLPPELVPTGVVGDRQ